jgi:hypothetical protein
MLPCLRGCAERCPADIADIHLAIMLVVRWLHILFGIIWFGIWFGGYVFLDFVIWPALLHRPAREARTLFCVIAQPTGRLMH